MLWLISPGEKIRFCQFFIHVHFQMITNEDLCGYIQKAFPDARVTVEDQTGTRDHFRLRVTSGAFKDMGLLDRHRLVYSSLEDPMKDGRIHAVEIKALTPEEDH